MLVKQRKMVFFSQINLFLSQQMLLLLFFLNVVFLNIYLVQIQISHLF